MNCLALIPALLLPIWTDVNGHLSEQEQINLCAQVRQESVFVPDAVSPAGARGLTQFMRPTWGDIGPLVSCPEWDQAMDPECSLLAQRTYMSQLNRSRICQGTNPDEPLQIALACYNGGSGWRRKERRLCAGPLHPECDPARWTGHQSEVCVPFSLRMSRDSDLRRTYSPVRSKRARATPSGVRDGHGMASDVRHVADAGALRLLVPDPGFHQAA